MNIAGSLILTHNSGWACTNECTQSIEFDKLPDGRAIGTMVFHPKKIFECVGFLSQGLPVEGMFLGDDGIKIAFNAKVESKNRIVVQGQVNNNFNTIIKSAKLWQ